MTEQPVTIQPDAPKSGIPTKIIVLIAVLIGGGVLSMCCLVFLLSSKNNPATGRVVTPARKVMTATPISGQPGPAAQAPAQQPAQPAQTMPKLGETLEQYGYSLSAVQVADPAPPGVLYEAEAGKRLVGVEVIVGNVSGEKLSVNPLYFTLVDADGFTYSTQLAGMSEQIATTDLAAGEKVKGYVAFVVPENAVLASIKFEAELFGDKVLQVGLTQ